jgi:molybdopterin-guanine dinucleotide biosynthesis protein A
MTTSETPPPLYGLVLAGGRGTRLARDKGSLDYHGVAQARWAFELLAGLCGERFVSVRRAQLALPAYRDLATIADEEPSAGPASGLRAALRYAPSAAWLVVAADMPLLDRPTLARLVAERDAAALATAYCHADGTPEPLCAIFEPRLAGHLTAPDNEISLRRLLAAGPSRLLPVADEHVLASVNTPAQDEAVRRRLAGTAGGADRTR